MTYHPAPRPGASVALRVLTGHTATKEQRDAAEALLADVLPDEQHVRTIQRIKARYPKPVGPTFWQLVDLGLLVAGAMALIWSAVMLIGMAMVMLPPPYGIVASFAITAALVALLWFTARSK